MNIVVDITPNEDGELIRQTTNQCLPRIQNISNFLPVDKDLTLSQKQGAWAGAIDPEDGLEAIAIDVAKEMVGTEARVKKNVSGTNTVQLSYVNDGENLVRVDMDKTIS